MRPLLLREFLSGKIRYEGRLMYKTSKNGNTVYSWVIFDRVGNTKVLKKCSRDFLEKTPAKRNLFNQLLEIKKECDKKQSRQELILTIGEK